MVVSLKRVVVYPKIASRAQIPIVRFSSDARDGRLAMARFREGDAKRKVKTIAKNYKAARL
jgi:hypothetical protein